MYERSTNHRESKEVKEIHSAAKAPDPQGMGAKWQRDRNCPRIQDSSPHSISLEESFRARGRDVFKRETAQSGSQDKGAGRGKPQIERSPCHSDPGIDVAKKRMNLV